MSVTGEDTTWRHYFGDECPGGHRAANVLGVNWDDQETAGEANARGATVEDVITRLAGLGYRVKTADPCSDPWCRGTGNSCGRTPQEHLEDGLTAEQFFSADPFSPSTDLWAVHIEGPDDILAMPSREVAEGHAEAINASYEEFTRRPDASSLDPRWHGVVVPWPFSAADHATALREQREEGMPGV